MAKPALLPNQARLSWLIRAAVLALHARLTVRGPSSRRSPIAIIEPAKSSALYLYISDMTCKASAKAIKAEETMTKGSEPAPIHAQELRYSRQFADLRASIVKIPAASLMDLPSGLNQVISSWSLGNQ